MKAVNFSLVFEINTPWVWFGMNINCRFIGACNNMWINFVFIITICIRLFLLYLVISGETIPRLLYQSNIERAYRIFFTGIARNKNLISTFLSFNDEFLVHIQQIIYE